MVKRSYEFLAKNGYHRNNVGQIFATTKNMDCFLSFGFFAFRNRSPIGNLFSTTLVFAHDANLDSGTTLLPHVVTSLQPLFRYFVEGVL